MSKSQSQRTQPPRSFVYMTLPGLSKVSQLRVSSSAQTGAGRRQQAGALKRARMRGGDLSEVYEMSADPSRTGFHKGFRAFCRVGTRP